MRYGLTKFSTRTKFVVGAIALVLAGLSHASGTLVGGGATLPSVGYVGSNAATTSNLQFFGTTGTNAIASGSLFGVYMAQPGNPGVSYCLTGSGAGKDVLAGGTIPNPGGTAYSVQNACSSTKTGFGAPAVSRTDLTQPSFAAADAPLAASDLANYQATDAHGSSAWPTQFPVIAGAVGIAFNLKDNTGAQVTAAEANFSPAQVCEIFSGTVTTWNASALASAFTLPTGRSIPANPINVQYRSDGSGTSFSLSNYLANNCSGAGLSHVFEASQTFFSATASSTAPSVVFNFFPTAVPTNWTGSSGNTGVANAINSTANSVGYVETANALALGLADVVLADVNSKSPTANFGSALTITSADLVYNEVISSTNATNGTAQLTAISSPPTTQCIALVPPADYAIAGSKGGIVPSTSYPIVAVSYFLGNAQGNISTDLTNTANLVDAPYNSTITGSVTTVGSGKGLAFLTLGTGAFSATAPGACLH